ncbi:zinc transporter ZntB [Oceaniglobus indicus]|uniref:zinc transporter ZntB n=1 Tax=Oceaniglobus indicus TaxID=2047749 RepID=UPI000C18C2B0|nr:zinc transporter ZntB [Oceaniglobus indicus]
MSDFIRFAHALGPEQNGTRLAQPAAISAALADSEPAWLHLVADHPGAAPWIDTNLDYLDPSIRAALTQPETRPRATRVGDGLLVVLRGINTDPGADPEDMIAIRIWLDASRIVSLSRRSLASVMNVSEKLSDGQGPQTSGQFLTELIEELTVRIEGQIDDLDRRADRLEVSVVAGPQEGQGEALSDMRLEMIDLRQFLGPQRDAIRDIVASPAPWLDDGDLARLREQLHRMLRVVELLEATRDRLQAIRDELNRAMDERLNRNLYVLSVISVVFLPLGFLTGLMGINLAGMPGASWPPAFWMFSAGLIVVSVLIVFALWWFRLVKPRDPR